MAIKLRTAEKRFQITLKTKKYFQGNVNGILKNEFEEEGEGVALCFVKF